jgi:hypothetical protein
LANKKSQLPWIDRLPSNYALFWGVATVIAVLLCAILGVIGQRYLNREFIGETTRELKQCRDNPDSNKKLCRELLTARGELVETPTAGGLRSPRQPPFQLADDDADLTPVS